MENYSIAEILSYRDWRHALFTTYALSLTFFESFVMRELRNKGCRDVSLVVDADGYQMSLSERRSHLVGQDYRLIPVALPKGVFHAKCMYLSSEEGDVLVVGSGNMTFGGFGRNLEVFEILSPDNCPKAFEDFADFLEYLTIKEDWVVPETTWLEKFSGFARRASKVSNSPEDQPRLWHTVADTAVDQMSEFFAEKGGIKEVNVLSPFFDNDGSAIKELAQKLEPQVLNIGLPTKSNQAVNFPFNLSESWGYKLGAFKPIVDSGKRTLHAKWMQIRMESGQDFDLTGSINATNKALCSTDNVEVGIIRKSNPENKGLVWEQAEIPKKTVTFAYKPSGLGDKCLVYATLKQDGTLLGFVLGRENIAGSWQGLLENKSGEHCDFDVTVNEHGHFQCHLQLQEQILFGPGLQIRMSKDGVVGRGWVNHDDILRLTKEQRSFVRLINREETIEDEVALLDYLAISAAKYQLAFKIPILNHKKKKLGQGDEKADTPVTIELGAIVPDGSVLDGNLDPLALVSGDHVDIMTQIRRILLGHNRKPETGEGTDIDIDPDDSSNDGKSKKKLTQETREQRAVKTSLDHFQTCIKALAKDSEHEFARKTALVIWYEVSMFMYRRHKQIEEATRFLREWFWCVTQEHSSADETGALEQHFVTVAAVYAAQWDEDQNREKHLIQIHEGLESYWKGTVDFDYVNQVLIEDLNVGFAGFLMDDQPVDLSNVLWEVFQTRTIREVLNEQIQCYLSGKPLDETASVFSGFVGEEFLAMAKRRRGKEFFKEKFKGPAEYSCPKCFTALIENQKYNLKYSRMAQCVRCSNFILDLEP